MARKPTKAPETEGDEAPDAPPAGTGRRKKLILAGLAALLLAGGGAGGFMVWRGRAAHAEKPAVETKPIVAFLDMREMIMNLASDPGGGQPRFIKLRVTLEMRDAKVASEVQPLMPRVEDTFQVYIRELRPPDLEGSMGTYRLREELLRRVNVAVYPARVDAVLFKDFVIQ
ncbi:flagellar basal body-associated protein FliL [Methylobacterium oryzihabitans]|uniref:Flagellar protein FliL n=1 Tax=Methylobacterium oryzihabitans TaxID=2499852 RepID=A0A437P7M4_9HYPH|nr:flagellar basal body-associated protein FliL [Methylobacterium oryzihabitans]RVU18088.1 flagellar basal body-associated protein FliL [Methylobacterium oryzihabitans]